MLWGYDWLTSHLVGNALKKRVGEHKQSPYWSSAFGNISRTWKSVYQSEPLKSKMQQWDRQAQEPWRDPQCGFRKRNKYGQRWVRMKNYEVKIHARKTKANTILEKWPVRGRMCILAPTYLFCIPEDQKELGLLTPQSSAELSPFIINHKSPKLPVWPLPLCPPLCQSLDAS